MSSSYTIPSFNDDQNRDSIIIHSNNSLSKLNIQSNHSLSNLRINQPQTKLSPRSNSLTKLSLQPITKSPQPKPKHFKLSKRHLVQYILSGISDLIIALKLLLTQYDISNDSINFTLDIVTLILTTTISILTMIDDKEESTKIKTKNKYIVHRDQSIHIRNTSLNFSNDLSPRFAQPN